MYTRLTAVVLSQHGARTLFRCLTGNVVYV